MMTFVALLVLSIVYSSVMWWALRDPMTPFRVMFGVFATMTFFALVLGLSHRKV